MRRQASGQAVGMQLRNRPPSRVPRGFPFSKAETSLRATAQESDVPGGVFDHGMFEEDGPATWEIPVSPARVGRRRGRPESRPVDAGKSEGCIGAMSSGNG